MVSTFVLPEVFDCAELFLSLLRGLKYENSVLMINHTITDRSKQNEGNSYVCWQQAHAAQSDLFLAFLRDDPLSFPLIESAIMHSKTAFFCDDPLSAPNANYGVCEWQWDCQLPGS